MDPAMEVPPGEDTNDQNKIQSEGLKFVFNSNRDNFPVNPCPYNDDGDPDMYSKENMTKREALKSNPTVTRAI